MGGARDVGCRYVRVCPDLFERLGQAKNRRSSDGANDLNNSQIIRYCATDWRGQHTVVRQSSRVETQDELPAYAELALFGKFRSSSGSVLELRH